MEGEQTWAFFGKLSGLGPNGGLWCSEFGNTGSRGSCLYGRDKSRKETRELAMAETKRKAAEMALTHIKSETEVKNAIMSSDIVNAYAKAKVRVIKEVEKGWFKTEYAGECFKVKIKAEVTPDPDSLKKFVSEKTFLDDPNAPLAVKLWTDKKQYQIGEK